MTVIAAYPSLELAYLARSRIESAGIEVEVRDDATVSLYWLYAPAIGGVKIAVPEAEVSDALEILRMPALEAGILVCPHCGSSDVVVRLLSPAAAILLVLCLPIPLPLQTVDCRKCHKTYEIKAHPCVAQPASDVDAGRDSE